MILGKANPTATAGQPGFEYMRDMASIMAGQLIGFWRWLIGWIYERDVHSLLHSPSIPLSVHSLYNMNHLLSRFPLNPKKPIIYMFLSQVWVGVIWCITDRPNLAQRMYSQWMEWVSVCTFKKKGREGKLILCVLWCVQYDVCRVLCASAPFLFRTFRTNT